MPWECKDCVDGIVEDEIGHGGAVCGVFGIVNVAVGATSN